MQEKYLMLQNHLCGKNSLNLWTKTHNLMGIQLTAQDRRRTIRTPKPTVSHYEERLSRSVVGEFNRVQREQGKKEISNGSSHNWLKANRPKVAICPHQDYCDTCLKSKSAIHAKQTTINRLLQSASATPEEIRKLEDEIKCLKQDNENHRDEAFKAR